MSRLVMCLALLLSCVTVNAASVEKARALFKNMLYSEAKKELIDVIYSEASSSTEKASSLFLLGEINFLEGNSDIAVKTWQELIDRYPEELDAELATSRVAGVASEASVDAPARDEVLVKNSKPAIPAGPVQPGKHSIRVLSQGREPRKILSYAASEKIERSLVNISMTMLESDCPSTPSKEKYPKLDMSMPVTITSKGDRIGEAKIIRVRMAGTATVSGSNANDQSADKAMDVDMRMTPNGEIVEQVRGERDQFQTFSAVYPSIPVGVGAIWEIAEDTMIGGQRVSATITYTLTALDPTSARMDVSAKLGGHFAEANESLDIEGGMEGETVWESGRFLPPGSSGVMFMRMTYSSKEAPAEMACILMAMETK